MDIKLAPKLGRALVLRRRAAPAVVGIALAFLPGAAAAQSNRTFVSGKGSDSNACAATTPCRSFQRAHNVTNAGGEITVLDSAGYGAVTITKSITLNAPDGIEAGVTPSGSGDGVTVNAPGGVVKLRGLTLLGLSAGTNGVTLTAATALDIQNCTVRGFIGAGLSLVPTAASSISVTDTVVANNINGVVLNPGDPSTTGSFIRVQAIGNAVNGFDVEASTATATDSIAVGNNSSHGIGFFATNSGNFTVAGSEAIGNTVGIGAAGSAVVSLTQTAVFGNTTSQYATSSATINTFGNNYIVGQSGGLTSIGAQ